MHSALEKTLFASNGVAAPELAGVRVLLVHEWLYTWAGAERCLDELLALMPHADVLAGIVTPAMRRSHEAARRARETWVGLIPGARVRHRWFLPMHALAFRMFDASKYDLVVSISHAFEKMVRRGAEGVHVSYCLTPPRYLWDQSAAHDELASPLQRIALAAGRPILRSVDRTGASGVDRFVSLSTAVAGRVRRSYGRDSAVVYPPVARKSGDLVVVQPGRRAREPFLLSLGRLVPYKRVDLAIAAAERIGIRLVVAGDGPERGRLQRMAGRHTEFVGAISDAEAGRLLDTCSAFVFCAEEDFGIAPVEANAHGAPVVAYGRGGARETTIDGETGVLFLAQTVDAVAAAIERCLATEWDDRVLTANAERFSPDKFREGMRAEIGAALARVSR